MPRTSAPETPLERREKSRYPVRLMLVVDCGESAPREAVSRDASEMGISFFCDSEIPPGSMIVFNVHVPPEVMEQEKIFVRGKGKVVRVEPQPTGRVLVAAVTEGYEFNEEAS